MYGLRTSSKKKRGRKQKYSTNYKTLSASGLVCKPTKGQKGLRSINRLVCSSKGERVTGSSLRCNAASKMGGVGFCHVTILGHGAKASTGRKFRSKSGKVVGVHKRRGRPSKAFLKEYTCFLIIKYIV